MIDVVLFPVNKYVQENVDSEIKHKSYISGLSFKIPLFYYQSEPR